MFTQCPKCETVYSLSPADLRAANGYVRCGTCDTTFSALSRLQDTPPMPGVLIDEPDPRVRAPEAESATVRTREEERPEKNTRDRAPTRHQREEADNADTQVLDERWADELDEFDEDLDEDEDWLDPAEDTPAAEQTTDVQVDESGGSDYFSYAQARSGGGDDAIVEQSDPTPAESDSGSRQETPADTEDGDPPDAAASGEFDPDIETPPDGLLEPAPYAAETAQPEGVSADPVDDVAETDEDALAAASIRSNELGFRDSLLPDDLLFGTAAEEPEASVSDPSAAPLDEAPPAAPPAPPADTEATASAPPPAQDATESPDAYFHTDSPAIPLVDDSEDRRDILNYLRPGLSPAQKITGGSLAVVLIAAVVAQAIHHWRGQLLLDERIGPVLEQTYQRLGMTINPATHYRDYEVARHTIVPREDVTTVYRFRATVYNRSGGRRPYPAIRITFSDRFGDEGYARTFDPNEYMDNANATSNWLAAGAAVEVSLDIVDLDPDLSTNYYVEACAVLGPDRVSCAAPGRARD